MTRKNVALPLAFLAVFAATFLLFSSTVAAIVATVLAGILWAVWGDLRRGPSPHRRNADAADLGVAAASVVWWHGSTTDCSSTPTDFGGCDAGGGGL